MIDYHSSCIRFNDKDKTILGSGLQTVDYTYNIRGWMTKINDPLNLGTDLFGYKINYNQREGLEVPNTDFSDLMVKLKYNGNIAEVSWKTQTEDNEPLKRYGYVYDSLNRLSAGFYQKAGYESSKEYFEKITYDLEGNISRLQRSAGLSAGLTTALAIDNLKYDYEGNKLTKVTEEQIGNSNGYPYLASPNTITYDVNGNMISHKDKGISNIAYNFLNLPNIITANPGTKVAKSTQYLYRADGVKVSKIYSQSSGYRVTDYLDGFQYITSPTSANGFGLKFVPTSEGYFDFINNVYIYNYTDHLGNVRLSYSDADQDGVIQPRDLSYRECVDMGEGNVACNDIWIPGEIVETNNYYPFGLMHNFTATTTNAYQYKYNGKELQETGMYDYGARFYMPDIGRWGVVDPLAETSRRFSTYMYALDNPIMFIDPDGREAGLSAAQQAFVNYRNSMPNDDYKMKKNGSLELLRKTNSDETKGVHTIYNENGDKSVTVDKNIIDKRVRGKTEIREGDDKRVTAYNIYLSSNEKSIKNLFNFIKDNVNNEFSLAGYTSVKKGGKEIFVLSTEFKKSQEGVGGYFAWMMLNDKNVKMTEFTHLHPGGTMVPSGFNGYGSPTEGDRGNRIHYESEFYKNRIPNNFNIVIPNSNKTIRYDSYNFEVK
jgi:RHS repeat-associated protein